MKHHLLPFVEVIFVLSCFLSIFFPIFYGEGNTKLKGMSNINQEKSTTHSIFSFKFSFKWMLDDQTIPNHHILKPPHSYHLISLHPLIFLALQYFSAAQLLNRLVFCWRGESLKDWWGIAGFQLHLNNFWRNVWPSGMEIDGGQSTECNDWHVLNVRFYEIKKCIHRINQLILL